MRNFLMESMAGETLAYADSQWFYFNHKTGKPIRASQEEVEPFGMGEPYPMEYKSRKVVYPGDMECVGMVKICENHLDTNWHVNNGEYIRVAADYLPQGYQVDELRAEYRLAAKLGDEVHVYTKEEEGCFYVVMMDKEKTPYVITCFSGKRKVL